MRLILLGAPGAGKGTQANLIQKHLGLPTIATGDMLRQAVLDGSDLGKQARLFMDRGELVPDELMVELVQERLAQADCVKGYLLDGFPRTLAQAQALSKAGIEVDGVIKIDVPEQALVERLSGRRIHPGSGRSYHVHFHPPQREGLDDVTGEPLVQREDDRESTVLRRLRVYWEQTRPVVAYYENLAKNHVGGEDAAPLYFCVSGEGDVEAVHQRVLEAISAVIERKERVCASKINVNRTGRDSLII